MTFYAAATVVACIPVMFAVMLDKALGGKEAGFHIPNGEHAACMGTLIVVIIIATIVAAVSAP